MESYFYNSIFHFNTVIALRGRDVILSRLKRNETRRPFSKRIHALGCFLLARLSSVSLAAVQVCFQHSYTGPNDPLQNTGDITLTFFADENGAVTMESGCDERGPAEYVQEFHGEGTVSDPALHGSTFSIVLAGPGGNRLRVSNSGEGLSVTGRNPQRIDGVPQSIDLTADLTALPVGSRMTVSSIDYAHATTSEGTGAGVVMNGETAIYEFNGAPSGRMLLDPPVSGSSRFTTSFSVISAACEETDFSQGYALAGLEFDFAPLPEPVEAPRPNIIVVYLDDMTAGQFFGFEGRDCLTPTIDHLAENGIRFNRAYAAATVCAPARYSTLTGRFASRCRSEEFMRQFPAGSLPHFGNVGVTIETDGENIGAWLQQAGYRTGLVGKAHIFDHDLHQTTNHWASYGLQTYDPSADPAQEPDVNAAMQHNHQVLCQRLRALGFDEVNNMYTANLRELFNSHLNVHNQEWVTKGALDFIDQHHDSPFFLWMAPTINHGPLNDDLRFSLQADPRYTGEGYLPNPDFSFMPTRQEIIQEVVAAGKPLPSARETWVDYSMAAITNRLDQYGISGNTLIVFTSDHGWITERDDPVLRGKSSLYDSGVHVPMLFYWPEGIASPGREYDELVQHTDLVPTFLDLAGISDLPIRPLDGISLMPVLNGSDEPVRSIVYAEMGYARAVRTRNWKYIALRYTPDIYAQIADGYLWPEVGTEDPVLPRPYAIRNRSLASGPARSYPHYFDDDQLYNLMEDPSEQTNLYGGKPGKTVFLKKQLATFAGSVPQRPFRQFDGAKSEFAPFPTEGPPPPSDVQWDFLNPEIVEFAWHAAASNELGFLVEWSTNGSPFEVVAEVGRDESGTRIPVDPAIEDILLRVASYNAVGTSSAENDADLLTPENWRYRTFYHLDPELKKELSRWDADPDGDGVENIWEYLSGTDPLDSGAAPLIRGGIETVDDELYLVLRIPRDSRRGGVSVRGRVSTNLFDWSSGKPAAVVDKQEDVFLIRSANPVGALPKQFLGAEAIVGE